MQLAHVLRRVRGARPARRPDPPAPGGSGDYVTAAFIASAHDSVPNLTRTPDIFSAQTGAWDSNATWDLGRPPADGEVVGVRTGHTVTVGTEVSGTFAVGVAGTLAFNPAANTSLTLTNLFVYETGTLQVGTAASPVQAGFTAELVWADEPLDAEADPSQYGHGLLAWGTVRVHGQVKTSYVRLADEVAATDTTLTFDGAVTGWAAGDVVMVPDSRHYVDTSYLPFRVETRTLSAVAGNNLSCTVPAMTYAHPGARDKDGVLDFTPHAANLTRNVIIRSANPNGVRGHLLFTMRADIDIRYARVESMGRTTNAPTGAENRAGRYAVHLHHLIGPVATPASGRQFVVKGCVVEETGTTRRKWGITIHHAHYGEVSDNVVWKHSGAGIMGEAGAESFNHVLRNLCCQSAGTGARGDDHKFGGDIGREGSGMWLSGCNSYVNENVCCNNEIYGYALWEGTGSGASPSLGRIPTVQGNDPDEEGEYYTQTNYPVLEFFGNEAYGQTTGLTDWFVGASISFYDPTVEESLVEEFKAWHCRQAVFQYPAGNMRFLNGTFRGDFNYLQFDAVNTSGVLLSDYYQRGVVWEGCDIQGFRYGVAVPVKVCDAADPDGDTEGLWVFKDGLLCNYFNVTTEVANGVTGGGSSLSPGRRAEFRNCAFHLPATADLAEPRKHLRLVWYGEPGARANLNWVAPDGLYFYDVDGVGAADFRVWRDEQAAAYVTPQTSGNNVGSPDAGQTNAANLIEHGVCVGGAARPEGTTTVARWDGQREAL